MAEEYTLSQEQSNVLENVISSIEENDGKVFSSEDLGIIKHIISPEDLEILRRYFDLDKKVTEGDGFEEFDFWEIYRRQFEKIEEGPRCIELNGAAAKSLMGAIRNIFHHALSGAKSASQENVGESNDEIDQSLGSTEGLGIDSNIQQTVYELYWEMISRCACGVDDAHEVSLALLDTLCGYFWVAQVALIVAAFAMSFGEFWLTVEPLARDPLSQSVCLLKRPDCLLKITDSMKIGLQSLKILVQRISDLTEIFVKYQGEILYDDWGPCPELRFVGYQVVYGVVTSLSHNIALVRMNKEYTTLATEVQQMISSSERLTYLHSYVNARVGYYTRPRCCLYAGVMVLNPYEDIANYMSKLISLTGKLVLGDPSTKRKVTLDKLKNNNHIALLISDFRVQEEEFSSLRKTYTALKNKKTCFEVVWVPMLYQSTTWTADNKKCVSSMGASMPWWQLVKLLEEKEREKVEAAAAKEAEAAEAANASSTVADSKSTNASTEGILAEETIGSEAADDEQSSETADNGEVGEGLDPADASEEFEGENKTDTDDESGGRKEV
ncbi:hypothetical protein NE237_029204 [Protea cynaroides]|uniref:Sieve element occlusion N-terminal domain-containing protein n=1 Tax=Protea cynaroides TaxID=273540 RepID=A0A9Q0GQS7_9MAGN|nr:hypothetical protein NE237_029204 [Protea cynaroides]